MSPERRLSTPNSRPDLRAVRAVPVNTSPKLSWQDQACADPRYPEGVVLLDRNHKILAFDEGAATILKELVPAADGLRTPQIPCEALDFLQSPATIDGSVP